MLHKQLDSLDKTVALRASQARGSGGMGFMREGAAGCLCTPMHWQVMRPALFICLCILPSHSWASAATAALVFGVVVDQALTREEGVHRNTLDLTRGLLLRVN